MNLCSSLSGCISWDKDLGDDRNRGFALSCSQAPCEDSFLFRQRFGIRFKKYDVQVEGESVDVCIIERGAYIYSQM